MNGKYENIEIKGIASAVPSHVINNMDYEELYGKRRVSKQIKMTGINKHHFSGRFQKTSDLCMVSSRRLLSHLGWEGKDVKVLIFVTQSGDYEIPSTAIDLADRLGAEKDCLAFDMNLGCSGYDVGIQVVSSILQNQESGTKALLLVGDVTPHPEYKGVMLEHVVMSSMMFGSAGCAIAIEKTENHDLCYSNYIDGSNYDAIIRYVRTTTIMNGNKVFDFAINDVVEELSKFKELFEISDDMIDCYAFHQAQKLILDAITYGAELEEEKVLISYDEYGNTSGASVPLTLCHNIDKFSNKEKLRVCTCGFGVGLSMGISYTEIETKNILPVIETDEHFDEHILNIGGLIKSTMIIADLQSELSKIIAYELGLRRVRLALVGNQEDIEMLNNQMFYKNNSLYNKDFILCNESQEKEKYRAVLFNLDEDIETKIKRIDECELLQESGTRIVILADLDKHDKQEAILVMNNLLESESNEGRCINVILYRGSSLCLYPDMDGDLSWTMHRMQKDDASDMVRPYSLIHMIWCLIRDEVIMVSGSLINIADNIKC